jgi:hypothetical protein
MDRGTNEMKPPLSIRHLLAAALAVAAVGLSLFVLSGGVGSLPAAPQVPAAVAAAGRVDSALADPLPRSKRNRPASSEARPAPAVQSSAAAVVRVVRHARHVARRTFRRSPRRVVVHRPVAPVPVAPATPPKPVSNRPAPAKPAEGKLGKHRGRSSARSKGHRSTEVKQSHKQPGPPAAPGQKRGHGGDNGDHGSGNGKRGGK